MLVHLFHRVGPNRTTLYSLGRACIAMIQAHPFRLVISRNRSIGSRGLCRSAKAGECCFLCRRLFFGLGLVRVLDSLRGAIHRLLLGNGSDLIGHFHCKHAKPSNGHPLSAFNPDSTHKVDNNHHCRPWQSRTSPPSLSST